MWMGEDRGQKSMALAGRVRILVNSEVACSSEGCAAKGVRFELAAHEASCEHREVSCEKCDQRLKAGGMGEHLLGSALKATGGQLCPPEESNVVWRIADLIVKAKEKRKEKRDLRSKVFRVQTTAGEYHMRLGLSFQRKA